jgi:hypothetical protein
MFERRDIKLRERVNFLTRRRFHLHMQGVDEVIKGEIAYFRVYTAKAFSLR